MYAAKITRKLSLAILAWIDKTRRAKTYTASYPASMVSQCKLVYGWGLNNREDQRRPLRWRVLFLSKTITYFTNEVT